jgi:hypothetical protein
MEATVNILELASELAHKATFDILINSCQIDSEEDMHDSDENGDLTYKDFVQDEFNIHYDYFYSMIEQFQIK